MNPPRHRLDEPLTRREARRMNTWYIAVYFFVIGLGAGGFAYFNHAAQVRDRTDREAACVAGKRIVDIATRLIAENSALLEESFLDTYRVRLARGEDGAAARSAELLERARTARRAVASITAISEARICGRG